MHGAATASWSARTLNRVGARARAWLSRTPLPPGDLIDLEAAERSDRRLLIKRAERFGPISKALLGPQLLICVLGLSTGRRLLKAHGEALKPVTLDLQALFPLGFLRQMAGEDHRRVRMAIVRALTTLDPEALAGEFESIAAAGLRKLPSADPSAPAYSAALSAAASAMLVRLFFGATPGSPNFERLMRGYQRLGPNGLLWNINDKQAAAYRALRDELRRQAEAHAGSPDADFARGLLGRLAAAAPVDETLLGNLIYMVEMGRYDLRGLLRWISHYAALQPAWLDRIAGNAHLAEAFVLETLRLDQSERLMRRVQRDIVFDGYRLPKDAMLRLCLWEAHKDPDAFAQPFDFDPGRFDGDGPSAEQFSPFGLDHHHCPFAAISVQLGSAFVRALASGYRIEAVGGRTAVRGAYHWEPAPSFSVTLQARERRPPA